jgi:predicted GNAT family acetyltransferase
MEVRRYSSAAEFLDFTKDFRSLDPVRTGLITSIATSVASGSRTYEDYFWWSVSENNRVVGLAIRTAPYGYVFSPMGPSAIEALFSFISLEDSAAHEFAGPKDVIDSLVQLSGKAVTESEGELIYECKKLIPANPIGEIRTANESDFDLIFSWMKAFMATTGLRMYDLEGVVRTALGGNRYYLLMIDGVPISMGGHSDLQIFDGFSIGRVGPIYTPEEFRKKGYASALTSEITKILISRGALPTLYTQAANPTSNKIYQEIGYTLVDENRRVVFTM